jgi:hypothetical protein
MNLSITPRRMMIYGVITAAALGLGLSGQSSDDTGTTVIRHAGASGRPHQGTSTLSSNAAAFLTRLAHRTSSPKTPEALFATHSWYVAPPPPPPPPPAAPVAPPAPTAPPLPFTLLGSYSAQGDQMTYFLSRGDRIYDVKLGDEIDAEYTLIEANGSNLIFNYKPLNSRQSLAVGGS